MTLPAGRSTPPATAPRVTPADGAVAVAAANAPGAGRARAAWPWVMVVLAVLVVAAIAGNPKSGGAPLDPSGTSPRGAKALRLLLEHYGAQVDVGGAPPQGSEPQAPVQGETALVLRDRLDASSRAGLLAWVGRGGTLIVADPGSELAAAPVARAPGAGGLLAARGPLGPACGEPALAGIEEIDPSPSPMLRVPKGATGCFTSGDAAFLVIRPFRAGTVVALGGPTLWTNAWIGKLDNSALAVALLAPDPGGRVAWLTGPQAGGGRRSLISLVPSRVKEGLAQLVVAFVLLALWRGRRLGRPVLEAQPVDLPGSELVLAVGNLLHRGHRVDQAAGALRSDLTRRLADLLRVGAATPPAVLADLAAARTGRDAGPILGVLAGAPPTDEAGLVALARAAETLRQEVANARP
ncbi:MAG TPA: DUF4350 domain-containing protein [Acidimicrobiales bacterium]|nr:DUF4350 domain-containing protein [Acidimicrobiales bacterium]